MDIQRLSPEDLAAQLTTALAEEYTVKLFVTDAQMRLLAEPLDIEDSAYDCVVELLSDNDSFVKRVEDTFYRYPFFAYPYAKITLYYEPAYFVVVPMDLYASEVGQSYLDLVKDPPPGSRPRGKGSLSEPLSHRLGSSNELIYIGEWDRDVELFFKRNLLGVEFRPYFAEQFAEIERKMRQERRAVLCTFMRRTGSFDVFAFSAEGQLLMANVYSLTNQAMPMKKKVEEMLFYLLSIWQSLDLSVVTDQLWVGVASSDADENGIDLRQQLIESAQAYVVALPFEMTETSI